MTEDGLITYDNLYELLRLEKYKKELQRVDKDFYEKTARYLNEKKTILQGYETKDSVFASQSIIKTKRQLENAYMILKELYEKRESKIVQMALFNSRTNTSLPDTESLLDEEKKLYNQITDTLLTVRNGILINVLNGKKPELKIEIKLENKNKTPNKLVRLLSEVSNFVGEDMNVYGPFKPEDVSNLPMKVADILIKDNKAEEI